MRTISLRTAHACLEGPCPHCAVIATAFRRALGLAGHPLPEHPTTGPGSAAFVSSGITIELTHECRGDDADDPHAELLLDGDVVPLPPTRNGKHLERAFLHIIETLEPTAASP